MYICTYFTRYVRFVSSLRRASTAIDPWQTSLNWLMGALQCITQCIT